MGKGATPTAVSGQQIVRVRSEIRNKLLRAKAEAEQSGKPLLILAGEDHISPESTLLEMIILQEAHKIGATNFSRELDKNSSDLYHATRHIPKNLIPHLANFYGLKTHHVDDLASQTTDSDSLMNARNANIGHNLSRIKGANIMVTGANHLHGLVNHPELKKSHTILSLDVTPDERDTGGKLTPSKDYQPITLLGDTRELSLSQMLKFGLGIEEDKFSAYLAKNDGLKTKKQLLDTLKFFPVRQSYQKHDVTGLNIASNAFYDLGYDKTAGEVHALARHTCKKLPEPIAEKQFCNSYTTLPTSKSHAFRKASREKLEELEPSFMQTLTSMASATLDMISAPFSTHSKPKSKPTGKHH